MQEVVDPRLDQILVQWEMNGLQTQKLQGKHQRFVYDFTFNVEKRAFGEFYYESPDKGRVDLQPMAVPEAQKVNPKGPRNVSFTVTPADSGESWICDGEQVTAIDLSRKEFHRIVIPLEARGQNIVDGPLPFLFNVSARKLKERYRLKLHDDAAQGGLHNPEKGIIHLLAYPLWQQDAASWERAEVLLNATTFFPFAVKLIHPGANTETVYTFQDVERNKRSVFSAWKDPFKPSLIGFKEMQLETGSPEEGLPPRSAQTPAMPPRN